MRVLISLSLIGLVFIRCSEVYDLKIENEKPALVVEALISDVSFEESKSYPSDGRFFTTKLRWTSDVASVRDAAVITAVVTLIDSNDNSWYYTPSGTPGEYVLFDNDFHVERGVKYKLRITLEDGHEYESSWEQIPQDPSGPIGDVDFKETIVQKYVYQGGDRVLKDVKGIDVRINLPPNSAEDPLYYIWKFKPTWTYKSPLISIFSDVYECWITSDYYLSDFALQKDYVGSYDKSLFFIEIDHNDKIFDAFTTLITQYSVSEEYYNYWKEITEQGERGGLFDPPPFNLHTNFQAKDPDLKVYGYFGVVEEQAIRWWFNTLDLSYPVKNRWKDDCTQMRLVQPPKCNNCLLYMGGVSTNIKPGWWPQ